MYARALKQMVGMAARLRLELPVRKAVLGERLQHIETACIAAETAETATQAAAAALAMQLVEMEETAEPTVEAAAADMGARPMVEMEETAEPTVEAAVPVAVIQINQTPKELEARVENMAVTVGTAEN